MIHPKYGDRVSLLGTPGTIEDVATCGWREFMCLVNFDACPAHWCLASDLSRLEPDATPCDVEPAA